MRGTERDHKEADMSSSAVERSFPSPFAVATPEGAEGAGTGR